MSNAFSGFIGSACSASMSFADIGLTSSVSSAFMRVESSIPNSSVCSVFICSPYSGTFTRSVLNTFISSP